jgi:hypothetical protein
MCDISFYGQVGTFKRPVKPIELYEFQGCPFCRKVRQYKRPSTLRRQQQQLKLH